MSRSSRRGFLKLLGLGGITAAATAAAPTLQPNYATFLKQILDDVKAGKSVDLKALGEILHSCEPGVAWYYCRAFYLEDATRPLIDSDKKLLAKIADYRGIKYNP